MTDWPQAEQITEVLQKAVAEASSDQGVITKWATICEVMQPDGEKNLQIFRGLNPSGCTVWDVKGMLHEMLFHGHLFEDDE